MPVDDVEEAVLRRLDDDLALAAVDDEVQQHERLGRGVVPVVAGRRLIVPAEGTVGGVEGQNRGEVEVVAAAGTAVVAVPWRSVAGADEQEAGFGVGGHPVPHGSATAGYPPLAGPGFGRRAHGVALEPDRRVAGDGVGTPQLLSRVGIVGGDVAAHPVTRRPRCR